MILGLIVVRLIFEFLMMALLFVKNVISINNKLRVPASSPMTQIASEITATWTSCVS